MVGPFFTQRTKSKFVFAGPSKSTETLFKDGEQEFTTADVVTEETIKPASKHTVEFLVSEACTLVWEVRVIGWDVCYGAEFVPGSEGGYTMIIQKSRKIVPADEIVVSESFKIEENGKVVLTFNNQTSKKKKLLYRSKTKPSSD
ncbi:Patellin-5 [Camellia lanceoleosa]|uniref:Patellin-5 n=1 Tax=Camellia lanceoleosa TaxID=1840588 RepID=A0ACC0HP47_9ERIC|nr:Patellin-5 [Camellia lanceoleosa]